jgi:hypothetical protein
MSMSCRRALHATCHEPRRFWLQAARAGEILAAVLGAYASAAAVFDDESIAEGHIACYMLGGAMLGFWILIQTYSTWIALWASVLLIGGYELALRRAARRDPAAIARSSHRELREDWARALSEQPGTELLAVQALRNSLMSATINASTAALGLMGTFSLMVAQSPAAVWAATPGFVMRLLLGATLFAAYVCSAFAMRYYHHAGFALSLPVGSQERVKYTALAIRYVGRAGILYSWSLRCFLFLAPIVGGLLSPWLMPALSLVLVWVLKQFDHTRST